MQTWQSERLDVLMRLTPWQLQRYRLNKHTMPHPQYHKVPINTLDKKSSLASTTCTHISPLSNAARCNLHHCQYKIVRDDDQRPWHNVGFDETQIRFAGYQYWCLRREGRWKYSWPQVPYSGRALSLIYESGFTNRHSRTLQLERRWVV